MQTYEELLSRLREKSLFRELQTIEEVQGHIVRIGDRRLVNFGSNDYLGLANHPEVIEVFCADTGAHLGAAYPSDQATPEQIKELIKARNHEAKQLRSALKRADRARRVRYAAAAEPAAPRALGAVGALEAEAEIAAKGRARAAAQARPDLFPPRPGARSWVAPRPPQPAAESEGARDEPGP